MKRLAAALACFLVALDCFGYAFGDLEQHMLQPGALWLYDVVAVSWILSGVSVLARGVP